MQVKLLTSLTGKFNHKFGDVAEFDDATAARLIACGAAQAVTASAPAQSEPVKLGSFVAGQNATMSSELVADVKAALAKEEATIQELEKQVPAAAPSAPADQVAGATSSPAVEGGSGSSESVPSGSSQQS